MALGLMFLMIQSAVAVTLPTTSYSPYSSGSDYSGGSSEVVFGSGTIISGSFTSLGTVDPSVCTTPGVRRTDCEDCCDENVLLPCEKEQGKGVTCDNLYTSCVNSCEQGGSLPLDGGLSILLTLALFSGAAKAFRNRDNA